MCPFSLMEINFLYFSLKDVAHWEAVGIWLLGKTIYLKINFSYNDKHIYTLNTPYSKWTLMITSTQVVETSVTTTDNSPLQAALTRTFKIHFSYSIQYCLSFRQEVINQIYLDLCTVCLALHVTLTFLWKRTNKMKQKKNHYLDQ